MDATPSDGNVSLRVESDITSLKISVTDTEGGIPESERGQILYPMYTTKEDGTGMGLSICLGIVENHGGTLTFDSRVGEGSVFTITFPKTSP